MDEINSSISPPVEILRHRAAIRRTEPSLPLKCIIRDNLLASDIKFFDYGCGYGDDIDQVSRMGISSNGWDPAYRRQDPLIPSCVINLGYVINVIENQTERLQTLLAAWKLTKKVLVVSARIAIDGSGDGEFEYSDGIITRIQTFQKYYTQTELREYIETSLGTEAIPAAPGVFYVFKDPPLRESFSVSKFKRRAFVPRRRASEIEFDRHRDLLEALISVAADLARLPFQDEFERSNEVIAAFGSFKRAFKLIRKVTGSDPWDTIRQTRIDDLKVYLALARFPKRPPFSQLSLAIQRDIKEFFGGYKHACDSADILLFNSGKSELVDAACQRSTIGRLTSNALYVHRSAISSLDPILRVFEGCARAYLGDIEDANVIKLHRFSSKVSYLVCPKFDSHPHPPVRRTIKLSLRNLFLQCIDHSENKNPLLLDRKERMIEPDHPWHSRFARFSGQEMQHGLLEEGQDMHSVEQWQTKFQVSGLMIRGYRLLYQEGVKRRRLPSKEALSQNADPGETAQDLPSSDPPNSSANPVIIANVAIDSDSEDQVEEQSDLALQETTRIQERPSRSKRFGVGKEIAYAVYLHRDYEERFGEPVEWAKRHLPEHFEYHVVKLNQRNDAVSFIDCPGFDSEEEPVIRGIVVVNADGSVQRRTMPSDPYIYHHKWLFVADDYARFDVQQSKERSRAWISLPGVDRSRIGKKSYWEANVVPRISSDKESTLSESPKGTWVRSKEAMKLLKVSSCDLCHLREQGKIEFKKQGNAYLYMVEAGR